MKKRINKILMIFLSFVISIYSLLIILPSSIKITWLLMGPLKSLSKYINEA